MGITAVLNRLASDVIQFSSEAQPWIDLDEVVCTGSSIMPQKKNPDLAELIRAGHSEVVGSASVLLMLTSNLGSGYHRDLQLTKEPVIKSINKTVQMLKATQILISAMTPNEDNLKAACTSEIFAAEAANQLVKEGMSFRDAYRKVAEHPELTNSLTADDMFNNFSHLGTPGNSGLAILKNRL
jgi:argininosuccinate lyase